VGYFESSVKRSKKNKQERQNEDHSKQNNKRISKNSDNPVASSWFLAKESKGNQGYPC